jgi:hypothetical protein
MRWSQLLQCLTSSRLTLSAGPGTGHRGLGGERLRGALLVQGRQLRRGLHGGVGMDGNLNLCGKTSGGGAHGYGTVFELTRGSGGQWTKRTLHSFCSETRCRNGAASFYGVTVDAAGILYGTSNTATFELSRLANGWSFSIIS